MKYTFSYIKDELLSDAKKPFVAHVSGGGYTSSLSKLSELLCKMAICPALFHDNKKTKSDFISCQFLFWDWDNGQESQPIIDKLKSIGVSCIVAGSKNHMKDKNDGKGIIERFHVIVPLAQEIKDIEFHKFLIQQVAMDWGLVGYDKQCVDSTRFFAKHSKILFCQETKCLEGNDLLGWYERTVAYEKRKEQQKEEKRMKEIEKFGDVDPATRETAIQKVIHSAEPAIENNGGDKQLFKMASYLYRLGGTISHLRLYNSTKCVPKFTESQLLHKWKSVCKTPTSEMFRPSYIRKVANG